MAVVVAVPVAVRRPSRRRARVVVIVVSVAMIAGFGAVGIRRAATSASAGQPLPTQAWYDPASSVLMLSGHQCGQNVRVHEDARRVRVATFVRPYPRGVACTDGRTQLVRLRARVGHRALVGFEGSKLMSFAWRSRLHLDAGAGALVPYQIESQSRASSWVLTYYINTPSTSTHVILTSTPGVRPAASSRPTVRGRPSSASCSAQICWTERGLTYQLNVWTTSLRTPAVQHGSRGQAVEYARRLVYT